MSLRGFVGGVRTSKGEYRFGTECHILSLAEGRGSNRAEQFHFLW